MDWLSLKSVALFAFFVLPGAISLKIFRLFFPTKNGDLASVVTELVAYSLINAAVTFYPLYRAVLNGWHRDHPMWFYCLLMGCLLILPILWAILFRIILTSKWLGQYVTHPSPTPWDYFFGQKKPCWVIVHLKDGRKIGGLYYLNSFASSYPHPEQLYLEAVVKIDENGRFGEKTPHTMGILITRDEWQILEFFGG
jgi:hypothetical protein